MAGVAEYGADWQVLSAHHTTTSTAAVSSLGSDSALWIKGFFIAATTESGTFAYHNGASSTSTPIFRGTVPAGTSPYNGFVNFPGGGFKCNSGLFVALTTGVNALTTIYST